MFARTLINAYSKTIPRLARTAKPCSVYQFSTTIFQRMATHESTTLKQDIPKQKQELPGLQKDIEPEPIDTKLETASGPKPYTGVGKLRGKKALITGGE